jgi:hypothetical protein
VSLPASSRDPGFAVNHGQRLLIPPLFSWEPNLDRLSSPPIQFSHPDRWRVGKRVGPRSCTPVTTVSDVGQNLLRILGNSHIPTYGHGALRVVVPLRTGKVTAKSAGGGMPLEGVSVAELTERIISEVVGRDGIEPPTPGFSVLATDRLHRPHFQRLAFSPPPGPCSGKWRPVAPCYAE